jgi:hypothetical protein
MEAASVTRSTGISGPALWALAGFGLYLVVGAGSMFLTALVVDPFLDAVGLPVEAGHVGLSVRNAVHPIVWGALVAVASVPIGRRLVGGIQFSIAGSAALAVGLALASITWFLTEEFVRARMEYFDMEYVGFSLLVWPALVAIGLSGWAALALPRGVGTPLATLVALAAAAMAVALLPSVAGALDGIEAANIPLALVFLVDAVYAVLVVILAFRSAAGAKLA